MSSNYDKLVARYSQSNGEDGRYMESRTNALEFYYTKKHLDGYITVAYINLRMILNF